MAAQSTDIETDSRLIAAAAAALAADAISGRGIAELLGGNEQELSELMAETVLAWREYLSQLAPPGGEPV
jgi:hypothetical protein